MKIKTNIIITMIITFITFTTYGGGSPECYNDCLSPKTPTEADFDDSTVNFDETVIVDFDISVLKPITPKEATFDDDINANCQL